METLKKSVLKALKDIGTWSTAKDVYNYMVEHGYYLGNSNTKADSVSSALVTSCRVKEDGTSVLVNKKEDKKPQKYGFPEWSKDIEDTEPHKKEEEEEDSFVERDLHQLLCNFLSTKEEYSKTIYHEKSTKSDSNKNWIHPDMVSAHFISLSSKITHALLKATKSDEAITLSSYELKISIKTDYELKQAYFQALSNSSWANYGYLVAFDISEALTDEIQRLNQSFGIGVILLGTTPDSSRILFPATRKDLDYITIDKVCTINPDFNKFIEQSVKVATADTYKDDAIEMLNKLCDKPHKSLDEIEKYCKQKHIHMM